VSKWGGFAHEATDRKSTLPSENITPVKLTLLPSLE
jgi:hypothetical protein